MAARSILSPPFPLLFSPSLSISPARLLLIRPSTRDYILKFSFPSYYRIILATVAAAATTRSAHNKPVDFSPVTPYTLAVLVRETSVCSPKGQRPTLTTRHGSTRLVRANTQKLGLFWFPGRYPGSPLLSPTTPRFSSALSLSLSLPPPSCVFLPPSFVPSYPSIPPAFSLPLVCLPLSPSFPLSSSRSLAARYIPMSVKPIAAWNDGVVPKWGLTEKPGDR